MKTTFPATLTLIALFSLTASGCVTRSVVKDEARQQVRFASAEAAQAFYETYLAVYYPPRAGDSVALAVTMPYRQERHSTDNVFFNAAVRSADSNRDGVISEDEARAYGESAKRWTQRSGLQASQPQ
jgi:hypothetical protein